MKRFPNQLQITHLRKLELKKRKQMQDMERRGKFISLQDAVNYGTLLTLLCDMDERFELRQLMNSADKALEAEEVEQNERL